MEALLPLADSKRVGKAVKERSPQGRRWVFTLNNWTEEEELHLMTLDERDVKYMIVGKEVGEEKTPHFQGYVELHAPKTLGGMKKLLGERIHAEIARGTSKQASEYCKKENAWLEVGEPGKQGKRTDLEVIKPGLMAGSGIGKMLKEEQITSFSQLKFAEAAVKYLEPDRDWAPEVRWVFGPPGSGKSRMAIEPGCYVKSCATGQWWDGYDAHEHVVLDDFREDQMPLVALLGLLDRYPYRVQTKGGTRSMLAKRITITSIHHPKKMYRGLKDEPCSQLMRRLTTIVDTTTEVGGNT